jgi:hypothetical protein
MRQLATAILLLCLLPVICVADEEAQTFEIANTTEHATAPKVITLDAKVGAKFAVEGPDGKHVPAWHDKKAGKVLILAEVPAGGGTYTVRDGIANRAKDPRWGKHKTKSEGKLDIGKVITRVSGSFGNELLEVTVPALPTVHGRMIIKARRGGYKIELSPLGAGVGSIEREEIAADIEAALARGENTHKEIFASYPSIATGIEVLEPNPYQRVMRVVCTPWARKNSGDVIELYGACGYDITLTWGSPVVTIRSTRNVKTTYWNHNGVNLNEIYVDAQPVQMQCDDEAEMTERKLTGNVLTIPFEQTMRLKDKTGETIIHQPNFKKLAIYRECVVLAKDRIMTVQSQSWHEGWKPIEIKAGDYEDTITLVCDAAKSAKSLKDWQQEF